MERPASKQLGASIAGEDADDNFGQHALNADGNMLVASAPYSDLGASNAGSARVHGFAGDKWKKISNDISGEASENYLWYVALSKDGSTVATASVQHRLVWTRPFTSWHWIVTEMVIRT